MSRLRARPMTLNQANEYIVRYHRHHGRVAGHRFIIGAERDDMLVGIVVCGRPRARLIEQYSHVEVTRLCTAGDALCTNVCSFLYSRASRIAREMGFASVFTAILQSEPGASLRASGWEFAYMTRGGSQDRPSRRRIDRSPIEPKQIWCPSWCLDVVRSLNTVQTRRTASEYGRPVQPGAPVNSERLLRVREPATAYWLTSHSGLLSVAA